MNIQPMNDYILVQRYQEPQKGVIVRPDVSQEKSIKGKVLAVGPGKMVDGERQPLDVKPGDVVLFNSTWNDFAGDHYTTSSYVEARTNAERDRLHLIKENDVFGLVNAKR